MSISVYARPRQAREHYERDVGESPLCRNCEIVPVEGNCNGTAEIELFLRNEPIVQKGRMARHDLRLWLCRRCASDLSEDLRGAIELVDGQEVFRS